MRKLFTRFLCLLFVFCLFSIPTIVNAQEAQRTVELYAEDVSPCYNASNEYEVKVSMRDFISLVEFNLVLKYNQNVVDFTSATVISPTTFGSAVTIVDNSTTGNLTFTWDNGTTPVTFANNVKTDVIVLKFALDGFPNNLAPSYLSDLTWTTSDFKYWNSTLGELVNTDTSTAGKLTVNVGLTNIQTSIAAETCVGGDATVTASATGATMYLFNEDANPALWVWTMSPDYDAAAGETVTVRVKDAAGCISLKKTITIPVSVEAVSFLATTQAPQCYGYPGSVVITAAGGTAPYKYYINSSASLTGATEKGNFQFSQMPGTYYVAVQDANGCADLTNAAYWQAITIVDSNVAITATSVPAPVPCYGTSSGSVTTTVSPAGAYQFSVNGGSWMASTDEVHTFSALPAGSYTVKARNVNGCEVTAAAVIVTQPSAPITFEIAIVDVLCGQPNTGQIVVSNIAGGTAPYDLRIVEGANITTYLDAPTTGYTFTGLKPVYYSLEVTDALGCIAVYDNPNETENVIAVQSPLDINYTLTTTDPDCNNGSATLTISNVTGGSGVYEYSFDAGATWGTATSFTWVAPYTAITVHVRNAADDSCAQPQNAPAVVNPTALGAYVSNVFPPTCIDGNDGNVYVNITGGTAPYKYSINGGSQKTAESFTAVKVMVGMYSIMIEDANGCIYGPLTGNVNLQENVIEASSNLINCYGAQTGTIAVNFGSWANGNGIGNGLMWPGVPMRAVEYYVENEAGQISLFTPSNHASWGNPATTFVAGTYNVWVVDQYTCTSEVIEVEIEQNPELVISNVVANGASCFGTYEGTITVHATGGTVNGTLQYAVVNNQGALDNIVPWKYLPFDTYDDDTFLSTVSFQVDGGTYYLSVMDNGCAVATYGPIVVEGYEQLLVEEEDIEVTEVVCYGEENGTIYVPMSAVTGGAGAYSFTLLDDEGDEIVDRIDQTTGLFEGLAAGTYMVLVEDAEGCPSYTTEEIVVGQPDAALTFTVAKKHISCFGANNGLITITAAGGTPNYKFAVNNPNTWFSFDGANTTKQYVATEPGTFTIWVKDANGCVTEAQEILILEPAAVTGTVVVNKNVTCVPATGGTITVTPAGGWNVSGGTVSTFEYKVNTGAYSVSNVFTNLPAGNHTVTIRSVVALNDTIQAHGECVGTVAFTITQPAPITFTVDIAGVKCRGGSDGMFTVNVVSGGTPNAVNGYHVRLTGNAYDVWQWTGTDHSTTFANLAHSFYTVRIYDDAGCQLGATIGDAVTPWTTVESWEVQQPGTVLSLSAAHIDNVSCYNGNDGSFSITAAGGVAPYKFFTAKSILPAHILVPNPTSDQWMAAEGTTYTKTNATAGTWIVWVMDANGCVQGGDLVPVNEYRVQILQPTAITFSATVVAVQPSCNGDSDGTLTVNTVAGGTAPRRVVATGPAGVFTSTASSATSLTVTGLPAGTYSVKVVDANDCESSTVTKAVGQPAVLTLDLAKGDDSFTCPDAIEGIIEATATGGNAPYTYSLYKNGVLHTANVNPSAFLVQIGNFFEVVVKDAKGCEASDTITINPVDSITTTLKETTCYSDLTASVIVSATGEEGRTFEIRHRRNTGTFGAWVPFTSSIEIENLIFANSIEEQNFYYFEVRDDKGCTTDFYKSFVATQHPLQVTADQSDDQLSADITITGGISPYSYVIGDETVQLPVAGNTFQVVELKAPATTITVYDAHGCMIAETITVAPISVTAVPSAGTNQMNTFDVVLTFNRAVTVAAGDITGGTYTPGTASTFTVTMTGDDMEVLTLALGMGIEDAAGNTFAGATFTYTVGDHVAPTVMVTAPVAPIPTTFMVGLKFSEPVTGVATGVTVTGGTLGAITGTGTDYMVTVTGAEQATVTIVLANTIADISANTNDFAGQTLTYTVGDFTAPTLVTWTPLAVTTADTHPTFKMTFNENVKVGTGGNLVIYKVGSTTAAITVPITTAMIVGKDVTVTYTSLSSLERSTDYYVKVDGSALTDLAGNAFAGVMSDVAWKFKTGAGWPTAIDPNISLEFKVYPNPFVDYVDVVSSSKLSKVVVTNIAGQTVKEVVNPSQRIQLSELRSGIYFISLYNMDNVITITSKIVKR